MLQAADLAFGYGAGPLVLDGVSLTLPTGGLLGILGPNGSGKTTLLRLLAGTREPLRGTVTLDGVPLRGQSRRTLARRIAVVPQETAPVFDYTALELVLMGRHAHLGVFEVEGPDDLVAAREALAATCALHLADRPFATLSGGERQRVVIAAALAQSAGILLLDEPTAALDLGARMDIAALLAFLHRERGVTMAISTHDLSLAAEVCQQLVLLRHGRVLAAGATDDVLTTEHVRALYDVEADVHRHPVSGQVVVAPLRRLR